MSKLSLLKAILAAESPELIVQAALEHIEGEIACDWANVVVFGWENHPSTLLAMKKNENPSLKNPMIDQAPFVPNDSFDRLKQEEVRALQDLSATDPTTPIEKAMLEAGGRAFVSIPLKANGEILGTLNLSRRIPKPFAPEEIDAALEIGDLLAIVIQQARRLKEAQEQAENLEQRLQEQTRQLEAANRDLESFAYSVSHDLRAPLRGLDGYSRALLEDYGSRLDEMGKAYLHYIGEASRRMASQIDDLLRLSRIMRSELVITQVEMSAMVTIIANQLQRIQPERSVTFAITPGLQAKADATLMNMLLTNLLDNAWKFTSKQLNAHIEFGVLERGSKLVYYVRDNGAGFNEAYQEKLFLPFQRLHGTQEYEGSGMGLAIVKRIVERHNGSIWAEGKEGKGATFYFTLQGDTQ